MKPLETTGLMFLIVIAISGAYATINYYFPGQGVYFTTDLRVNDTININTTFFGDNITDFYQNVTFHENITINGYLFGGSPAKIIQGITCYDTNLNEIPCNITTTPQESISLTYGELCYHNHIGVTVPFTAANTYYNLMFNQTKTNGMINNTNSSLQITQAGIYKACYLASGSGENNNIYYTDIMINDDQSGWCESHYKMSAGGDITTMSGCCIINLTIGDNITLATANIGNTGSGTYYAGNLNLIKIS